MIVSLCIALVGLLAVRRFFFGYPIPQKRFAVLAPREVAFLSATAEVMFPAGGAIPISGTEADLPSYADQFLRSVDKGKRWEIRALFMLFEQATLFFPGGGASGWRRFSSLSLEQRELVLQGWHQSPQFLRQILFVALRAVLTMGYLGHPAVTRHLRVAPYAFDTPICEADLLYPAVGQHPDTIKYTREDLTPPSSGEPLDLEGALHERYRPESDDSLNAARIAANAIGDGRS
ncbi:MAG: hypothetical protein ACI8W3_002657 [Myxococcota bacterium]